MLAIELSVSFLALRKSLYELQQPGRSRGKDLCTFSDHSPICVILEAQPPSNTLLGCCPKCATDLSHLPRSFLKYLRLWQNGVCFQLLPTLAQFLVHASQNGNSTFARVYRACFSDPPPFFYVCWLIDPA